MVNLIKSIFSAEVNKTHVDLGLLFFRILVAGGMINTHGLKKILDFEGTVQHIPDPFGMGGFTSAVIAIVANIVCAAFVIFGLFTRLNALFILNLTLVGFFIVHGSDPWPVRDIPFMYSIAFGLILFLGAGRYSLDNLIQNKLIRKNS